MADDGRNPLELDAIVQRFAESAEALASVREQLQVLNELRETEEKANALLEDSAGQLARFTTAAASILKGLEDAQTRVAEVLKSGADLLDGTELKGVRETVRANAESISSVASRVDVIDSKVTELKGVGEAVRANAESISGVASHVDALDSKVAQLTGLLDALQTTLGQGIDGLNSQIKDVHADVKNPIIVKRFSEADGYYSRLRGQGRVPTLRVARRPFQRSPRRPAT